ncbi:MAG: hypothetical protein HSCHL_1063 [Hydrogenibacillus schlegelii]|uniref:Uncharacterized protein n=1 Tax=Hydrogenibacillus schlegelii TaxID=1484 RepID=A0A2T5GCI6_HYDSH|nr:MAG: hypothetical protein HSCHL_1063 [Hydrogenibacillus schlegelii]
MASVALAGDVKAVKRRRAGDGRRAMFVFDVVCRRLGRAAVFLSLSRGRDGGPVPLRPPRR